MQIFLHQLLVLGFVNGIRHEGRRNLGDQKMDVTNCAHY